MSDPTDEALASEIEVLEDLGTAPRVLQGLAFLRELQRHRATMARIEEWARELDDTDFVVVGPAIARRLRNRIKGG